MAGDDVVGDLTRWLAEARVDAAAASRARARWLRAQLDEEATVAGVLLDLAERGDTVVLHQSSGRHHRGRVRAVAEDFCALRGPDGRDSLHPYDGLASIEPHQAGAAVAGDRPATLDMTFAEALLSLAGDRPRVLLVGRSGVAQAGELRTVGRDVVVLRPDGEARAAYVPIASIAEVTIAH